MRFSQGVKSFFTGALTSLSALILTAFLAPAMAQAMTYSVTTTAGDTSAGSLGAALTGSGADGAALSDTISFNTLFNTTQTITLSASYPSISKSAGVNLTLNAPGALLTLDGNGNTLFNFSGGGTLSLSNLSLIGSVGIGSGSILSLDNVKDAGGISGAGELMVSGGSVTLLGSNTFNGGISVGGGSLVFQSLGGAVTSLGSSAATLTLDGGALDSRPSTVAEVDMNQAIVLGSGGGTLDSAARWRMFGVISGTGGLTFDQGIFDLTTDNTYSGGTTVNAGAVVWEDNIDSLGDGASTIVLNGGTIEPGVITGGHELVLTQDIQVTAAGGTLSGDTVIGGGGLSGVISGPGGLNLNGGTTYIFPLVISNQNTYSGGTTFTGAVAVDEGSAFGTAATVFVNGGLLEPDATSLSITQTFDLSGPLTLGTDNESSTMVGTITGNGNLSVGDGNDHGTWTLSAANSYTGNTTVNAVLKLSGNGTLGRGGLSIAAGPFSLFDISAASGPVTAAFLSGSGFVSLGANQLVDGTDNSDSAYSGVIQGTGSFLKNGTGTLTLSGANSFTGGFVVNSGTILAGSNASLGMGSVTLAGGTLAMTGGPRTLSIAGDYIQDAAATLKMGLAGAFPYDQVSVAGAAQLAGNLDIFNYSVNAPTSGQSFLLLQSTGALTGRFDSVTNPFSTVRLLPVYEANQVYLVALLPSFYNLAVTPNEKAVAAALDNAFGSAGTQDLTISLGTQTSSSLTTDYDQMAPTGILPAFQIGFAAAQAQGNLVARHFSCDGDGGSQNLSTASRWPEGSALFAGNLSAGDEAAMMPSASSGWSLFMERQNSSTSVSGDANAPGYQFTYSGLTAGMENRLSKDFAVGLLLGYGQGGTVPGSNGSVNITGGQAGLYGGWRKEGTYVEVSGTAGLNRYQAQQPSYGGYAAGSTSGVQFSGQIGLGHDWNLGPTRVGFFGTGQATYVGIDGFTESGSLAPLSFAAQGETSVLSDLGARVSRQWTAGDFSFSPGLNLAWEHRYQGASDSLSASFAGGGGFTVAGPQTWSDGLAVEAGLEVSFAKALNFSFQYRALTGLGNGGSEEFSSGVEFGF